MNAINKRILTYLVGSALALGFGVSQAAPTYVFDNTTSSDIPGLTGFSTTGAMMDGMSVTVDFVGGGSETRSWADTGPSSGGVTGTGWSLTETGDTFGGTWTFAITSTDSLSVQRFSMNGNPGFTIFDVDMYQVQSPCDTYTPTGGDQECSPGSARGARMVFGSNLSPTVTYSDIVGVAGAPPVGDLWHVVGADFGADGIRTGFTFTQDTDNDSRLSVPEPATIALLGIGLAGLGISRRRKLH